MSAVRSFPALVGANARVLVLGSMPGRASLRAQQYYAHPRNAFWSIVQALLGIDRALPYETRCERLAAAGVAVWDVLASCYRPGSLDADILADTVVANDIAGLLDDLPGIRRIVFNGGAAETLFRRHVLASISASRACELIRLPSTSPAYAAMDLDAKIEAWRPLIL